MASPSPHLSPRQHYGSISPPPVQTVSHPLSKRDKRRTQLSNSLVEMTSNFNHSKDEHYRAQLSILNAEMRAIADTDCHPDDGGLLPDLAAELENRLSVLLQTSGVNLGLAENRPGRFYQPFIEEVNEAVERRDFRLTELHMGNERHEHTITLHNKMSIHNAEAEYQHLFGSIRTRLLARLQQARKKLIAEKDHMDVNDQSWQFLHPSQFSLYSSERSPGGKQHIDLFASLNGANTRKLRGRRGDEVVTDAFTGSSGFMAALVGLEGAGLLNAAIPLSNGPQSPGGGTNGKRKRKTPRSVRDLDDFLSCEPSKDGTSTPPTPHFDSDLHPRTRSHKPMTASEYIKPLYSLDKLFTEKELTLANTVAAQSTVRYYTELYLQRDKEDGGNGSSDTTNGNGAIAPDEDTVMEDDIPASTGPTTRTTTNANNTTNNNHSNGTNGNAPPLIPHTFLNKALTAPAPPVLRVDEISSDLEEIKRAISGGGDTSTTTNTTTTGKAPGGLMPGGVAMSRAEGTSAMSRRGRNATRDAAASGGGDDDGAPTAKRGAAGLGITSAALERGISDDGDRKKARRH